MNQQELDKSQQVALAACFSPCRVSIVGAPGTGKSHVLTQLVVREASKGGRIAVLTLDRRAAASVHNDLVMQLGSVSERVTVQTLVSFAFGIVKQYAQSVGRRDPELISGPDEDVILSEILTDPDSIIDFPSYVDEDLRTQRGLRSQMRDLITRATELGYGPRELVSLGKERGEPMWVAGGQLLDLYETVTLAQDAFSGSSDAPDRLDHAHIIGAATSLLSHWQSDDEQVHSFPRPRWDWVIVDDIENAPRSIIALLAELAADGASIVVTGDPDAAVQGFRGGVASLPGDVCLPAPEGLGCERVALRTRHRGPRLIAQLADRIAQSTRVAGRVIDHRNPEVLATAEEGTDEVRALRFVHREEEAAWIAQSLRRAHLVDGIPYSQMAVLTRSRSMHASLRSSLVRRGVPVAQIGSDRPLRESPVVYALTELIRLALEEETPPYADVFAVLTGPLLAMDPLTLREVGRVMRGQELVGGGRRSERDLIVAACLGTGTVDVPGDAAELTTLAGAIDSIRRVAQRSGAQAEEVLWAAWNSAGRADERREAALSGENIVADAANAELDDVIRCFRIAQRMADRNADVTIWQFFAELEAHDLPQDSIARAGAGEAAVVLSTPNASIGRSWDLVVISGLEDGLWPNMKLRDTYTHTSRLAQIATGREVAGAGEAALRREAFEDVVDDELRQLHHAVTRARRRLVLTCVDSDETNPSRFFSLMGFVPEEELGVVLEVERGSVLEVRPEHRAAGGGATQFVLEGAKALPRELDPLSLVAQLRRALDSEHGAEARMILEELREAGLRAADPRLWVDGLELGSSDGIGNSRVRISPSALENILACPLRGLLGHLGAAGEEDRSPASVGTLIHELAEEYASKDPSDILEAFEARWEDFAPDAFDNDFDADAWHAKARSLAESLREYLRDARERGIVAETEVPFSFEAGEGVTVAGSIDRIEREGDSLIVADIKTGTPTSLQGAQEHIQLRLYQFGIEKTRGEASDSAQLVYLKEMDKKAGLPRIRRQAALTEEARSDIERKVELGAAVLRAGSVQAVPSDNQCRNCPFHHLCPAQSEGRVFS